MLVLTRRVGEKLIIGDDINFPRIEVGILRIQGKQVAVGITAPKGLTVHREEIYQKIHQMEERKVVNE